MNVRGIWIILIFFISVFVFTAGCTTQPSGDIQKTNALPENMSTPAPTPSLTKATAPPSSTPVPVRTPPVTYSVSNPLAKDDYYRFTSGENEIIARFVQYELTDNYGEIVAGGTEENPVHEKISHAPKGTRYLFVYFTFLNIGRAPAAMPGAEMIRVITENKTYTYPEDNPIPRSPSDRPMINQVNGTRKNMNELYPYAPNLRLPVGKVFSPDWTWYVPFSVPDTFDPNKSYVSFTLDNTSSATWKFV